VAYFIGERDRIEAEISTRLLKTAMSGDTVEVKLFKKNKSGLFEGRVIKVLERAKIILLALSK
jgi:exoribonuclease R